MDVTIMILLFIVLGFVIARISLSAKYDHMEELGIDSADVIEMGAYLHGHPDIDHSKEKTFILKSGENLEIYEDPDEVMSVIAKLGEIPIDKIDDVTLEDASSMESKVTLGRLAMVGIFAFALKKRKKEEQAYIVVEWKSGRFKNQTIFEFQGKGALQKGNTARNRLIKHIK